VSQVVCDRAAFFDLFEQGLFFLATEFRVNLDFYAQLLKPGAYLGIATEQTSRIVVSFYFEEFYFLLVGDKASYGAEAEPATAASIASSGVGPRSCPAAFFG